MRSFLVTGCLGELKIGMPISDAIYYLGEPEAIREGLSGWRIEADCGRTLQISHHCGSVKLLGIYFSMESKEAPRLPAILDCRIPFSGRTTQAELKAYL